jgi:hypothetical protein
LDERDARLPMTRADFDSTNDDLAADVVAAGGGTEAVIETTRLRTYENMLTLINPTIVVQALDNDAAATAAAEATAEPARDRLRRLQPDRELVRRRADGETLRSLAADYQVTHTTMSRYFRRPQVAQQLKQAKRHERQQSRHATG